MITLLFIELVQSIQYRKCLSSILRKMKNHKVYFYTCDYYNTFDAEVIPNICESPDSSRTIKIYNL